MFIASCSSDQGAWEKTERAGTKLNVLASSTGTFHFSNKKFNNLFLLCIWSQSFKSNILVNNSFTHWQEPLSVFNFHHLSHLAVVASFKWIVFILIRVLMCQYMSWQMKELEDRYREREQQWQQTDSFVDATVKAATPDVGKSCMSEECPSEIETGILRCSDSENRQISQGSSLFKGNDSTHKISQGSLFKENDSTHKIRSKRSNDENNFVMPSSLLHDRRVARKSDPPKIVRGLRPTPRPVTANLAPVSHKRASTSRDQVQGIKERDTKKKIWSR